MKKNYFIATFFLFCSVGFFGYGSKEPIRAHRVVRFDGDEFKIINFSDFHSYLYVEGDRFNNGEVKESLRPALEGYLQSVLDEEKPDFVVLTGDNIFCNSGYAEKIHRVGLKTYGAIAQFFEKNRAYWSMTFGNHDPEAGTSKKRFVRELAKFPYFIGGLSEVSLSENYRSFGLSSFTDQRYGNFSIPIYDSGGNCNLYNLFLFDSGGIYPTPKRGIPYRFVRDEQVDWYVGEVNRLKATNGGEVVPSLMFTHIEIPQQVVAYGKKNIPHVGDSVSLKIDSSQGMTRLGEMAYVMGDVRGFFSGHRHKVDYTCLDTQGERKILFGTTPQAHASSYDPDSEGSYRCRVIVINQSDGDVKTRILERDKPPTDWISYHFGVIY